jgi:dihydroxy-acid dehydratase
LLTSSLINRASGFTAANGSVPLMEGTNHSALPGRFASRDVTVLDSYEAVGAVMTGDMDEATLARLERSYVPTIGASAGAVHR